MDREKALYFELAKHARRRGLIDPLEINLICRAGTTKESYWTRHLKDLCDVLSERLAKMPPDALDDHLLGLRKAVASTLAKIPRAPVDAGGSTNGGALWSKRATEPRPRRAMPRRRPMT